MNVKELHHNGIVNRQSNLNTTIELGGNERAWSGRYIFTFTKSPFPGQKIKSGEIEVTIGETSTIKKLIDLNWHVNFDSKKEAEIFFNHLKTIFEPLSTKKKIAFEKGLGLTAEYSIKKSDQKGIRNISFVLDKAFQANYYQIYFFLFNDLDL